jgi:hypothetical protein
MDSHSSRPIKDRVVVITGSARGMGPTAEPSAASPPNGPILGKAEVIKRSEKLDI